MLFDPLLLMIAVLAAGLSGQLAFRRSFRRINEARRKVRRIVAERNILVQEIRKAAHQTLRLKQDLRLARPRYAQLEQECANLERELEAMRQATGRVIVLDDRCLPEDKGWIVVVAADQSVGGHGHPHEPVVPPEWTGTRKFLVWAKDENGAGRKLRARYPAERGYHINQIALREA